MTESKKEEIKSQVELLYKKAAKLVEDGEITLPNDLKELFLKLDKLTDEEQLDLLSKLSKSEKLPDIIRNLIELVQFNQVPLFLSEVPEEIPKKISIYEDDLTLSSLALTNKKVNTLFKTERVFTKFLQQVVYGGQDKVEELFTLLIKQKRDKEIQELLCKSGTVTDYSGRTFHCTGYEYAYWAKDTHMCRMLEQYIDEDSKAEMLNRCEAIEKEGLKYTQNKKECCTKHFDLTPLKTALQEYINGYDNWYDNNDWVAMKSAWMKVGLAQRDVPVHVINEYCRLDRSFEPTPKFNEDKLPRVATFYNFKTDRDESLFPLAITESSGPGVDFGLFRGGRDRASGAPGGTGRVRASVDLLAVSRLDEVRTQDLKQSLDNLKPKEQELRL